MTACLCVENWNGKIFVSLYYERRMIPSWVKDKIEAGFIRLIDIADGDIGHNLDLLKRLYLQQIDTKPKTEEQAKAEAASTKTAEQKQGTLMKKSELVKILDGIIRTSNQQGEIDAAMAVYRKVTGKEWRM